jgi:hypothetical protein
LQGRFICYFILQHRYAERDALMHGSEDGNSMQLVTIAGKGYMWFYVTAYRYAEKGALMHGSEDGNSMELGYTT